MSYIVTLEEDPETGDLVLPLPEKLMEETGWKTTIEAGFLIKTE